MFFDVPSTSTRIVGDSTSSSPSPSSGSGAPTPTTGSTAAPITSVHPPVQNPPPTPVPDWTGVIFSSAFLAALLAATINLLIARHKSRDEERARLRVTFAEAFSAYTEYCEFAYAIRRRRDDDPAGERVRLSEAIREVQARLSHHLAWTELESSEIGQAYKALVDEARRTAGAAMREAWNSSAIATDSQVNVPPGLIDLSGLKPLERRYLDTVAKHLRTSTHGGGGKEYREYEFRARS
jgi:hypothetical protein